MHSLSSNGILNDALVGTPSIGQYRRAVQAAAEQYGLHTRTAYGTIVQTLELQSAQMPQWHYINPFALLAYLCIVNRFLYDLIITAADAAGGVLRIIVYIDDVNPGNPLRPDQGRM